MMLSGKKVTLSALTVEMFSQLVSEGIYKNLRTDGRWPTGTIRSIIQKDFEVYKKYPELLIWSVWVISNNEGYIVGDIGFKGPPDGRGIVEIGYQILPEYRNRGYVSESIQLLCDFAFFKGVEKIEAEIHVNNHISQRVIQKNGFVEIGQRGIYKYFERVVSEE